MHTLGDQLCMLTLIAGRVVHGDHHDVHAQIRNHTVQQAGNLYVDRLGTQLQVVPELEPHAASAIRDPLRPQDAVSPTGGDRRQCQRVVARRPDLGPPDTE